MKYNKINKKYNDNSNIMIIVVYLVTENTKSGEGTSGFHSCFAMNIKQDIESSCTLIL